MRTELAKKAIQNIAQFKDLVSDDVFSKVEEGIKALDNNLNGFGYSAIEAEYKLKQIAELKQREFVNSVKYLNEEP